MFGTNHHYLGLLGARAGRLCAALLAAAALAAAASPAAAQDATWLASPGSGDFNTGANWSTATVPTGTAFFGTSGTTSLSFSQGSTTVGGWTFNAGASNYTFTNGNVLNFTGAGIVVNGGSAAITNTASLNFNNTSTAGSATITNNGHNSFTFFNDTSTAGTATITNTGTLNFNNAITAGSATINNAGGLYFYDTSTAGSAVITNNDFLYFNDTSTAGSAAITNNSGLAFNDTSTAGSATITNNLGLNFIDTSTAGNATITNTNNLNFNDTSTAGSATITNNRYMFFSGLSTAGSATITNNGILGFLDTSTAGNAAITNNGILDFSDSIGPDNNHAVSAGSIAGAGRVYLGSNALEVGGNDLSTTVSGAISDCGVTGSDCNNPSSSGSSLVKTGTGTLTLSGVNTYSGGTTLLGGTLSVSSDANLGAPGGALTFNGGTLQVTGTSFTSTARTISWGAHGGGFDIADPANTFTVSQSLGGAGWLTKLGAGTLVLSGANSYGRTTINGGTLRLSGAGTLGAPTGTTIVNGGGTLDLGGTTQTQGALILIGGTVQNGNLNASITLSSGTINGLGDNASLTTTSGTTTLTGNNTFASTTVNGGILDVIGTLSDPTINAGGTLIGTGSVGATQVNAGGIFAPGNGTPGSSMTVTGNLAFQSGAIYLVQVNPSTASFATVTGSATLGGASVNAVFASGSYVAKQYTILTAGSVSGTFASTVVNTNLPTNFKTDLGYDASHAYLDLSLAFVAPPGSGLTGNQQGVGNAIVNFFNRNGGISLIYSALTANGLTQASGEGATGSQQTTFHAMSLFLGLLTDPFMGRGNGINGSSAPTGYAEEEANAYAARKTTDAFAMFSKAPLAKVYEPRWSVWAAGYGGSQSTSGNAVVGSNDTTSQIAGTAVGADYLFSPDTLAGFALAGGGTSFSVNNLGSGRSDLFQAGAYVRHTNGPAYISGALAYGWQDITTNRTVTIAGVDQLRAEFNANAWSGRLEGGYRFVAPATFAIGITPYAAAQFSTFDLPEYAEQAITGTNAFALAYGAHDATNARTELGIRTDKTFAMADGILTLRGRFGWAHDYDPDRAIAATFQSLPGASFVVNGAAQASDSALTTASVEMKWKTGWSAAATFEGEFSEVTSSYAGKGVVRYQW